MEKWFRIALFATAAMNILGALAFVPANRGLRGQFGFPEAHPLYLWIIAVWIFAFGLCYLWMAIKQSRERLFIVIGAIGKFSFFGNLLILAMLGELPWRAALGGLGDLIFAVLLAFCLTGDCKTGMVWFIFPPHTFLVLNKSNLCSTGRSKPVWCSWAICL